MRTAQAFGTQSVLADLYDKYIVRTRKVDMSAAIWHGGGLASFFFVIYASYALGKSVTVEFCGSHAKLILQHSVSAVHSLFKAMVSLEHPLSSAPANSFTANAGDVVNVFFAILIGSFSLAMLAPEMQGPYPP